MAIGFRKSFKVAPGVRLNMSKRGPGISAGPRHMKTSINSRGQKRRTFSFMGLFWRKQS